MKKHIFAEKFRGLYSPEIDNMIDIINKMTNDQYQLNEELNIEPNNMDKLMEYYYLTNDINELFEQMYQRSNEIDLEE